MINLKNVKTFCCEDRSLIENYEEAVNSSEMYDCHHRLETDEGYSVHELKDMGLYYNRPASELIFLTHGEHMALHRSNTRPETRAKLSAACKGEKNGFYGKKHSDESKAKLSAAAKNRQISEETRAKLSAASKGNKACLGKHWNLTEETKSKISAAKKGKTNWATGKHWYKDELTGKRIWY